ncbi:hypothetical protein DFJ73DRAFT_781703 [Zopfochytrium polystomum]|nr:hypothetical protein DFJ73DRAFT_781703 [Zopfochytrium polystomum]
MQKLPTVLAAAALALFGATALPAAAAAIDWEAVAVRYAPQYKFHPKETIFPITIEDYLSHVQKSVGITSGGKLVTYQTGGPFAPQDLNPLLDDGAVQTDMGSTILDFGVKVDVDTKWVTDGARKNADNWKLYTYIYDPQPNNADGWVEIQYWMFYPFNYVPNLTGDSQDHPADLVANAIRFNKADATPTKIWYAQHGDGPVFAWSQGRDWADTASKKFATVLGTHPIVYVSRGNHEHYTKAGDFNWVVIAYWDHTANGGLVWSPYDRQSAFEFVHVNRELTSNADRKAVFQGKNAWMAFNGKIGGHAKVSSGDNYKFEGPTGINAISFQKNQGHFTDPDPQP